MTKESAGFGLRAKIALLATAVLLHLFAIAFVWFAFPVRKQPIKRGTERTAISSQVLENVREKVEFRQLEELRRKLSELKKLQEEIAAIRASRVERWQHVAVLLEDFIPQSASLLVKPVAQSLLALRESLSYEAEEWHIFDELAASPKIGTIARDSRLSAVISGSRYEDFKVKFSELREQQRLLLNRLALGATSMQEAVGTIRLLEKRVSDIVARIDSLQSARDAYVRLLHAHQGILNRVAVYERSKESSAQSLSSAEDEFNKTQLEFSHAQHQLQQAAENLAQIDTKDDLAVQSARYSLKKAQKEVSRRQNELQQRQRLLQQHEQRLAKYGETILKERSSLRQSSSSLAEAFQNLEKIRTMLISEAGELIEQQESLNRTFLAGQ